MKIIPDEPGKNVFLQSRSSYELQHYAVTSVSERDRIDHYTHPERSHQPYSTGRRSDIIIVL